MQFLGSVLTFIINEQLLGILIIPILQNKSEIDWEILGPFLKEDLFIPWAWNPFRALIKSDHDLGVADDDGGEGHDKLGDIGEGSIDQLWKSLPSFLTVGDLGHGVSHKLHEEGVAESIDRII